MAKAPIASNIIKTNSFFTFNILLNFLNYIIMKTNNFVKPENKELKKQVTLVGMMGVGKTTFGKKLAAKLQVPFYDVDHEIEGDIGHSVSWIFENAGEEEFRKLETEKIRQLLDNGKPKIVALGGGAFISNENRKEIRSCRR